MAKSWAWGASTVFGVHLLWFGLILAQAHADRVMGGIIVMLFVAMNIAGLGAFITAYRAPRHRFVLGLLGLTTLLILALSSSAQSEDLTVVFEKPGVDLRTYRQILVKPLNLIDARIVPPPWVENADPKLWSLTRENQAFLRNAFASSICFSAPVFAASSSTRASSSRQPSAAACGLQASSTRAR